MKPSVDPDGRALARLILPLRLTFGLVPILAGIDKFFNLLADWPGYVSPALASVLPLGPSTLMHLVGPVEILVGILVLGPWTRWGAAIASAWLTLIAVNLVASGSFDVAVRDLGLAVAAFTLFRLVAIRDAAVDPVRGAKGKMVEATARGLGRG